MTTEIKSHIRDINLDILLKNIIIKINSIKNEI